MNQSPDPAAADGSVEQPAATYGSVERSATASGDAQVNQAAGDLYYAARDLFVYGARQGDRARHADPADDDGLCPYPGLAPFGMERAQWYFGRDPLINDVLTRLAAGSPLAVVGPSGSGKSSLLTAGLRPALTHGRFPAPGSRHWPQLVLTPTAHPVAAPAQCLATVTGEGADRDPAHPHRLGRAVPGLRSATTVALSRDVRKLVVYAPSGGSGGGSAGDSGGSGDSGDGSAGDSGGSGDSGDGSASDSGGSGGSGDGSAGDSGGSGGSGDSDGSSADGSSSSGSGSDQHAALDLWDISDPHHPAAKGRPLPAPGAGPLASTPDGRTLISADLAGTVRLWDLDVEHAATRICATTDNVLTPAVWTRHFPGIPYQRTCP